MEKRKIKKWTFWAGKQLVILVLCFGMSWVLCHHQVILTGEVLMVDLLSVGLELFALICAIELCYSDNELLEECWRRLKSWWQEPEKPSKRRSNSRRRNSDAETAGGEIRIVDLDGNAGHALKPLEDLHIDHYQRLYSRDPGERCFYPSARQIEDPDEAAFLAVYFANCEVPVALPPKNAAIITPQASVRLMPASTLASGKIK